jgi:TfoX/Sxy family transcriptional regulator of competence genes
MSKKPTKIPEERLAAYEALIDTHPEIERKGKNNPYTSVNGHMFSTLSPHSGELGLRLPKDEREAFLEKYDTQLFESYGAVMKEYVAVPRSLLMNTEELKDYFRISYDYVKSLKPKPTKRKKKS